MRMSRKWSMPSKNTFSIKPIKDLILQYYETGKTVVDPFANNMNIKQYLREQDYFSNDIDNSYNCDCSLDAVDYLKGFIDNSVDIILFDPPFSNRQVSECYKKLNKTVTQLDTSSSYFSKFKDEIARVLTPYGVCISCGWNSNGIGKTRGFKLVELLLVAHGGAHNDTIVTVEYKSNTKLKET